ncbi:unnamed protein product [Bursaphelenchus xylophilus]|uniref:Tyrosine-protein kinase n=1 Tax=Bursaphelenchus xylophilus TaxID=6326 RepID=A0A1I7SEA5_BURXY|nr:unnamed protein product [Bursaphelenchus xylophilus]CAG9087389.1 unnamed protein product [Bursaphelenchus xylophilus]
MSFFDKFRSSPTHPLNEDLLLQTAIEKEDGEIIKSSAPMSALGIEEYPSSSEIRSPSDPKAATPEFDLTQVSEVKDFQTLTCLEVSSRFNLTTGAEKSVKAAEKPLIEIKCVYRDLNVEDEPYFHGLVRSIDTVVMLTQEKSFLVHQTAYSGVQYYVLSHRWMHKIHHRIIGKCQDANDWFINEHCAPNIVELIDYHCAKKIPVNEEGAIIKYAVPRRDWSLNVEQLMLGKAIGKGEFGLIYKAKIRRLFRPDKKAVVKVLLNADKIDRFEKARLFCEAQLMMSLRHKNVLRIYGICAHGEDLILALERASNGSLLSYLQAKHPSSKQKLKFCRHLASGMAYLSKEGLSRAYIRHFPILHRDLAARNCLVSKSGNLKVADFGLSTSGLEAFKLKEKKVPIRWLAPEVLLHNTFSGKSDSWSFGVVLFEIWSDGQRPYDEIRDKKLVRKMVIDGYRLTPPEGMPGFYADVMAACFHTDPIQRCSLIQIERAVKNDDLNWLVAEISNEGKGSPQTLDEYFSL